MNNYQIFEGNCLEKIKEIPKESVDCIMTSPPYWALRDYGTEGQLGLEPTFQEYINKLCDVFDECKKVLKKTGTLWVNIGDTYAGSGKHKEGDADQSIYKAHKIGISSKEGTKIEGYKDKCLCMIPFRFALEMVNRGWILRNTIIWHKPNCMPMSVTDRFTVDFEYLFFFVKNKKYYFEQQFEPLKQETFERSSYGYNNSKSDQESMAGLSTYGYRPEEHEGRNKRTVWQITTKPFNEAHFAVYPEELCEIPIKSGCPEQVCMKCGKPRQKIYKQEIINNRENNRKDKNVRLDNLERPPPQLEETNKRILRIHKLWMRGRIPTRNSPRSIYGKWHNLTCGSKTRQERNRNRTKS